MTICKVSKRGRREPDELKIVYPLVVALNAVGEHRLELLYLFQSGEPEKRMAAREQEVRVWCGSQDERLDIVVKIPG